jgi:Fe-S-cluster containining protein
MVGPEGARRCIFLAGTLGEAVTCTAYHRRPQVCKDFEAGTPACHAERARRFGDQVT